MPSQPRSARRALRCGLPLALGLAVALPATASAAELTLQGGDLRYTAGPGETNLVAYSQDYGQDGTISVGDIGASVTYPADRCTERNGNVVCAGVTGSIVLDLGDGNDSAAQPAGQSIPNPVELRGGAGDDVLEAPLRGTAATVLVGEAGSDKLRGADQADELRGGPGNDSLEGGAGADRLFGEEGDDELDGDTYKAASPDVLDGGPGMDRVRGWTGPGTSDHPPVRVTLDGVANDGRPGEGDDVSSIERLTSHVSGTFALTDADDEIDVYANLDGGPSTITTNGGRDAIRGANAAETIDAGAGDDRISGGFGDDTITGGPGRDTIAGDKTDSQCGLFESCSLPQGNDTILARDGEADSIDCGVGTDRAVVDALDTVAPSCEVVERGAAGGTPSGDGGQGGGDAGKGAAKPAARAAGVRIARRGGKVLVRGRVRASGLAAAALRGTPVTVRLLSGRRTIKRVNVKAGRDGRFTARLRARGAKRLSVRVTIAGTSRTAPSAPKTYRVR
jgi:Ca2+-binding RTX toxin-like protein